jgi:hypothetical protein
MTARDHIESQLGAPTEVFVVDGPGAGFRILELGGVPHADAVTYVTEGISAKPLRQPSGPSVRQEFVLAVRRSQASDEARRPLGTVGDHVFSSGQAVVRGEVIDGQAPLVPGSRLSAVCCLAPAILPKDSWLYEDTDPPTMYVWLVPLSPAEAAFARDLGPDEFEGVLVDAQDMVDLLDVQRSEFVPGGG